MNNLLKTAALLSVVLLFSCKKPEVEVVTPEPEPATQEIYQHGTPTGTAVAKVIGPEGGTLTSTDGRVQLIIPVGAVTKSTEFSIQPVENTLPGAQGESFRLLPEKTEFTKPVTLRFSYSSFPMDGTIPEALFLSYQDAEGRYWLVNDTALDTGNKTLTVQTTHFSDWQVCEEFRLAAGKTALETRDTTYIKLYQLDADYAASEGDTPIDSWVPYEDMDGEKIEWTLNGEGKLRDIEWLANYEAPGSVPAKNPVFVSMKLTGFLNYYIRKRLVSTNTQLILTTPIEILDKEYVRYTFRDISANINGDCETGCISSEMSKSTFSLRANMSNNRYLNLWIHNFPGKAGLYEYNPDLAGIEVNSGLHTDVYVSSHSSCQPPYNSTYSTGGIQITRWATKVGEYTEGSLATKVYRKGTCKAEAEVLTCKFRLRRQR